MVNYNVLSVVGARPNFIKVAALHRAFQQYPRIKSTIVHTGQHAGKQMSDVFFDQLGLPEPAHFLGISGGSHTRQTAEIMLEFERVLEAEKPDLVVVVGDVNSTIACALVAVKMKIPLAHVEAGLRSGDRGMPEEINRIVTDAIADLLFVSEPSGLLNLQKEGIPPEKVFFTGNCMIDSLIHYQAKIDQVDILRQLGLMPKSYLLFTMHRPSNVDSREGLETILRMIELISQNQTVVFPMHPRTRSSMEEKGVFSRLNGAKNLYVLEAQGYLEFQHLLKNANAVITDSGGVQEETTYLQVPCLTFRTTTERPVTVETGTNELLSELNPDLACAKVLEVLNGTWKPGKVPDLWDGKAAERIAERIHQIALIPA